MAFILLHLCRGHQNHRWWRFPNSERPNCFLTGSSDFMFCGHQLFTPGSSMHVVQRCSPCDALIHKPSDNVAIVDSQQKKEPNPEAEGQTREKEPVSEFTSKHEKLGKDSPECSNGGCAHNYQDKFCTTSTHRFHELWVIKHWTRRVPQFKVSQQPYSVVASEDDESVNPCPPGKQKFQKPRKR